MTDHTPPDPMGNDIAYDPQGWHDVGLDAWRSWDRLREANTLIEQATAVEQMNEVMVQLATWLPGYSYRTGEITDPRDEG